LRAGLADFAGGGASVEDGPVALYADSEAVETAVPAVGVGGVGPVVGGVGGDGGEVACAGDLDAEAGGLGELLLAEELGACVVGGAKGHGEFGGFSVAVEYALDFEGVFRGGIGGGAEGLAERVLAGAVGVADADEGGLCIGDGDLGAQDVKIGAGADFAAGAGIDGLFFEDAELFLAHADQLAVEEHAVEILADGQEGVGALGEDGEAGGLDLGALGGAGSVEPAAGVEGLADAGLELPSILGAAGHGEELLVGA